MDWHGKPLGPKADASLELVKSQIKNHGPHNIKPLPFPCDAPKVDLTTVKLASPPNYKLGEKVLHHYCYCCCYYLLLLLL